MSKTLEGDVILVRRHTNGDIDIGFLSDDQKIQELHYFTEPTKGGKLTKEIAHALAKSVGQYLTSKIFFDDNGISTSVEFVVSEDDEDDSEED